MWGGFFWHPKSLESRWHLSLWQNVAGIFCFFKLACYLPFIKLSGGKERRFAVFACFLPSGFSIWKPSVTDSYVLSQMLSATERLFFFFYLFLNHFTCPHAMIFSSFARIFVSCVTVPSLREEEGQFPLLDREPRLLRKRSVSMSCRSERKCTLDSWKDTKNKRGEKGSTKTGQGKWSLYFRGIKMELVWGFSSKNLLELM